MLFIILGGLLALFSLIAFLHRPKWSTKVALAHRLDLDVRPSGVNYNLTPLEKNFEISENAVYVNNFYFYFEKKTDGKNKKIPGLKPSDPDYGNIEDIQKIGMGKFLKNLHQQFGPIASFWEGKKLAVSTASPEFFKTQKHLENQSVSSFEPFRMMLGDGAFVFCDGEEVARRRKIYDHYFMVKGCKIYSKILLDVAHEYMGKWKFLSPDEHIPLCKTTLTATMKGISRTLFGNYFENDDAVNHLENLWFQITKSIEMNPTPESGEEKKLKRDIADYQEIVKRIIQKRKNEEISTDQNSFIDLLLSQDVPDSQRISDSIMFITAGYEPTGRVLMWLIYRLTIHPEIQEKLHDELVTVLGDRKVSFEDIPNLTYLRQLIDETVRLTLIPMITNRQTEDEMKIGEYLIPPQTNIYQALGVVLNDPQIWPDPEKFDPDRFSIAETKKRDSNAFKPFGVTDKRQCPGQTFATTEMSIFLAEWCRQFQFIAVNNEPLTLVWNFILHSEEEVWISLKSRQKIE